MRIFWRKGYAATSISDLTSALGIGATSLYAAFGCKEALYAEALQHYSSTYDSHVWGRSAKEPSARGAVEALLMDTAASLGVAAGEGVSVGCMVMLSAAGPEGNADLGICERAAREGLLTRVTERLARAPQDELPPGIPVEALARFVVAVSGGLSIQARDGATQADLQAIVRAAMALWDAGLAGRG
ncbi:TetR/AcrR family transcriptional regulator [Terrihabitans sp. B22-R8]|uniref:TetR/AcrR family transcriptional regulator n=1 Tax=Terrihabitans sp. B22-R8 TaxID=3425128 RepID=UPI00403D3894